MRDPRRSYAARVLVVPLSGDDERLRGELEALGVEGVDWLSETSPGNGRPGMYRQNTLSEAGPQRAAASAELPTFVEQADVVVLFSGALAAADPDLIDASARASRSSGALIASVLVGGIDTALGGHRVLARLREGTDMLVSVRDLAMVAGFLDVIRGGRRDPHPAPLH